MAIKTCKPDASHEDKVKFLEEAGEREGGREREGLCLPELASNTAMLGSG